MVSKNFFARFPYDPFVFLLIVIGTIEEIDGVNIAYSCS